MPKADAASTASALDKMTAGVMARKTQAAAQLTKVGKEVVPTHAVLPATEAMFPNDIPTEVVVNAVRNIRKDVESVVAQAGFILAALDAVEEHLGKAADAAPVDIDEARKAKEREADKVAASSQAEFAADFARQQQEAQEAVYTPAIAAARAAADAGGGPKEVLEAAMATDGWACPTHGAGSIVSNFSRKGREYRVCTECDEFERL